MHRRPLYILREHRARFRRRRTRTLRPRRCMMPCMVLVVRPDHSRDRPSRDRLRRSRCCISRSLCSRWCLHRCRRRPRSSRDHRMANLSREEPKLSSCRREVNNNKRLRTRNHSPANNHSRPNSNNLVMRLPPSPQLQPNPNHRTNSLLHHRHSSRCMMLTSNSCSNSKRKRTLKGKLDRTHFRLISSSSKLRRMLKRRPSAMRRRRSSSSKRSSSRLCRMHLRSRLSSSRIFRISTSRRISSSRTR
ncbi:hypothetical protein FPV67DRAFT_1469680 [Lyophyllum atratum]|nr:hypothetical protein FPV67DRAFT_1469680 [Lyophyllum atratum]